MNFKSLLESGHEKKITSIIVEEVLSTPEKLDELIHILEKGDEEIARRAAWPISYIAEKNPIIFEKHLPILVKILGRDDVHTAIYRNILRALQFVKLSEEYEGEILDRCFCMLNSSKYPIAVKVFSMSVIYNLTKKYPEIKSELKSSIEALMPDASAGVKSRGSRILKLIH